MGTTLRDLCDAHAAWYDGDNDFQRKARLRQSMWRDEHGLPIGERVGSGKKVIPWGSRLRMPEAKDELLNYLTPEIGARVRKEIGAQDSVPKESRKLISEPRIYDDLLSSQPLCFNLFAALDEDLELASRVFRGLWPGRVDAVDRIEFEYSPGRRDPKYLDNRSAFDVFVRYRAPAGAPGFAGIEVKYHEDLKVKAAAMKDRYAAVAEESTAFVDAADSTLRESPLQQIWLDHLLALSMLQADDGWSDGFFVLLAPSGNTACQVVARNYAGKLNHPDSTFETLDLERIVSAVEAETDARWIGDLRSRYLDFSAIPAA